MSHDGINHQSGSRLQKKTFQAIKTNFKMKLSVFLFFFVAFLIASAFAQLGIVGGILEALSGLTGSALSAFPASSAPPAAPAPAAAPAAPAASAAPAAPAGP